MISVIITSYKEPKSIIKAIESIANPLYSGFLNRFELITVIPDTETIEAAKSTALKFPNILYKNICDPRKGKPYALNMALDQAKGDILVLTDGDVYFEKNALKLLIEKFKDNKNISGVTGRPISDENKSTFFGYVGNLLADAAHHKRMATMSDEAVGNSLKIVSRNPRFFVMSGYILAFKNFKVRIPVDCLIEDAYLSYLIFNKGQVLAYEPNAKVVVKYPKTSVDWYKQKLRSVGGYIQLWKYNVIKKDTKIRNFWKELEYFWFPLKYQTSFKELIWSLLLYPLRLYLWGRIFWEQRIIKKDLIGNTGWERIESTK